jgi:hypothetical protein
LKKPLFSVCFGRYLGYHKNSEKGDRKRREKREKKGITEKRNSGNKKSE